MPPDRLAPLLAPLTRLRGVGDVLAGRLARLVGGERILDLLLHLPTGYIDRRARVTLRQAVPGAVATVELTVVRIRPPATARQPTRVVVEDPTGTAELVFFAHAAAARLTPGLRIVASGRFEQDRFENRLRMTSPDHLLPLANAAALPCVEPVWPLAEGLGAWHLRRAMAAALAVLPDVADLPEWQDPALLARERWPGFAAALCALQSPEAPPAPAPRRRLAYDELLADQLALQLLQGREERRPGRALPDAGPLRAAALARFGHRPTPGQSQALAEIDADMAAPRRMRRLLQGDVGSGKTLVAVLAMLRAAEAGAQAALMAPTELLARQHARTLERISPIPSGLLTGAVTGRPRARLLDGLASGDLRLVVGTHALFSEAVAFRDLALVVIDEQHRFGVEQRMSLSRKGPDADLLMMTATPIPRTVLAMSWTDKQVSRLTDKPAGRLRIETTLHGLDRLADVEDAVARKVAAGGRVYWVCPLVHESEATDLAAAEARYAALQGRLGPAVGLAHGQQEPPAREAALADFAAGRTRVLVATTVIEVGVDVPEASVMVIEHAERFGLAALHQLRGRVGRGHEASFCLLLHDPALTEAARRRLALLRDTDDGFAIADEDFRLRGGGDLLGTRQSGAPGWRMAHPVEHEALLHMARRDAAARLSRDPALALPQSVPARVLLRLFGKSRAIWAADGERPAERGADV